jgi:hypothetical protein
LWVEIWEYHLEDGIGKGLSFTFLLFLNLSRIYLLTLIPDSIAPFMYPWEIKAVSVPAQWISPYGYLKLLIFVKTPGGRWPHGAPPMLSYSFQTFISIAIGFNIYGQSK